jgi:endonuclease G
MKRKVAVSGSIAIVAIIAIVILCVWAGKKLVQKLPKPIETTNSQVAPEAVSARNSENSEKIHLALGNPSGASSDVSNSDNYLMVNDEFAISYNRSRSSANWVAWRIAKSDMSDLPRDDSYRPDDRLPNGWTRITPGDYSRSGYTRGHMCPSADRDKNAESMAATFLMTNMVPQTYDLNAGPWAELEGYLRSLAWRENDVYVVAGVYGDKGKIKRKLSIPTNNWKIAVILRSGSGIEKIDEKTRVIAVDMPNIEGIKDVPWKNYQTTIREIERKTGYDFLSNLGKSLQDKLEN